VRARPVDAFDGSAIGHLRSGGAPGQEFVETIDWVVGAARSFFQGKKDELLSSERTEETGKAVCFVELGA